MNFRITSNPVRSKKYRGRALQNIWGRNLPFLNIPYLFELRYLRWLLIGNYPCYGFYKQLDKFPLPIFCNT